MEKISLPRKYQKPGSTHTWSQLLSLYEDLKRDYYYSINRIEDVELRCFYLEKRLEREIELTSMLREQNAKLYEAGRYAVYGKPPADLSSVIP